ncbi:MAG: UbiA family prenyltransferase [Rubripirellula sp.]
MSSDTPQPGTSPTVEPSRLKAWAQLVRLPNVFTVLADVSAAFLLVSQGPQPINRFVVIVLAGVALYWAGMILNDVFDVDRDIEQRPGRPIPAGQISIGQAQAAGWGFLLVGVALAALAGRLPAENVPLTWLPAGVGLLLAVVIVAYDGPLKKTPLAPVAMGGCRVLSFLLGASACMPIIVGTPLFPKYILAIAVGFGVYVMGITTMARHEATGGPSPNLPLGLVVTGLGAIMLAIAPQMAVNQAGWHLSPKNAFPLMIGMIALPVIMRGIRAVRDPSPVMIQTAIRVGILTIIPLAASFAFLGAGPTWGIAIFLLAVPTIYLSLRFRVT